MMFCEKNILLQLEKEVLKQILYLSLLLSL
jgi:hypothetical protein